MSENTKIEWADHTFNPWIGCTKMSLGCDGCYAEARMDKRLHIVQWGPHAERKRTSKSNWKDPVKWNANAAAFMAEHGRRQRVFCASLADVFDNQVDPAWRVDLFQLIADTPNLDWLLLTKRIGNATKMLDDAALHISRGSFGWDVDGQPMLGNVWLGATVVNQEEADRDIPKLLAVPARVRFLSIEPMLGPVDLTFYHDWLGRSVGGMWCPDCPEDGVGIDPAEHRGCLGEVVDAAPYEGIDWVICGGESGPGARPMHPDWARSLRDQCAKAGVPFMFKQWGEWEVASIANGHRDSDMSRNSAHWVDVDGSMHKPSSLDLVNPYAMVKVGKKKAGRLLDGIEHNGFPMASRDCPGSTVLTN